MKIDKIAVFLIAVAAVMVIARAEDAAMLRTASKQQRGAERGSTIATVMERRSLQQQGAEQEEADEGGAECNGCDYEHDPICRQCLKEEHLIVVCGSCFYTNECFAREAGKNPSQCKIVIP